MKKSKILSLVLAVAMVIACFAGSIATVSAETDFTLTVGTVEAVPGSVARIPLVIENNPGVCAFCILVEYDDSLTVYKLLDGNGVDVLDETGDEPVPGEDGVSDEGYKAVLGGFTPGGDLSYNPIGMTWWDELKANKKNGTTGTIEFTVPEDAEVGSFLEVKASPMYGGKGDVLDQDGNDLELNCVAGGISIVAPATEAPATQAPATQAPATQAPATEAPATEAPATQAPATEAPATEAPATQAPATEAPATEAPATEAPATEAPATKAPVTQAPATQAPAADDNANTGDSFAVFAAIAAAIVVLGAVVVVRRKKA